MSQPNCVIIQALTIHNCLNPAKGHSQHRFSFITLLIQYLLATDTFRLSQFQTVMDDASLTALGTIIENLFVAFLYCLLAEYKTINIL